MVCKITVSYRPPEQRAGKGAQIDPLVFTDIGQRTRVRVALASMP